MLVVVEDGDIAALLESALDLKAPGGRDVPQIDAAKRPGQQRHGVDDLIHVVGPDAQGDGVHPAKGFEQGAFALHHRHPGLRPDVPQTEDGAAVGDHSHQVAPAGVLIGQLHIVPDPETGLGHPGGIGDGQLLGVGDGAFGDNIQLPAPVFVGEQGFFLDIHTTISVFPFICACG